MAQGQYTEIFLKKYFENVCSGGKIAHNHLFLLVHRKGWPVAGSKYPSGTWILSHTVITHEVSVDVTVAGIIGNRL